MTVSKKGNCYVIPKEKESSEARASRFKKMFNRSRLVQLLRGKRYRKSAKTRRVTRDGALMREKYRAERERKRFYL